MLTYKSEFVEETQGMIDERLMKRINELFELYKQRWGKEVDLMIIPPRCVFVKQKVQQRGAKSAAVRLMPGNADS